MAEFKRSRLKRETGEEITKKTVLLGLLTVVLFALIMIFGLPLLVRFSIMLGDIKKGRESEITVKELPPSAPRLIVPFEATNSATLKINGIAESGSQIDLLKNEVLFETTEVDETGEFAFEDVSLDSGVNIFTALARREGGGTSEVSKVLEIVYDDEAPELVMINPSETELTVESDDFDVVGKSETGTSVFVNGRVAMVDDEGRFKLKIQLNAGKNDVEVVVRDLAGNETKKKIQITYEF